MKPESAALAAITEDAPDLSAEAVAQAVEAQFGLAGEFALLVSERDQNFMLRAAGRGRFLVKVTSAFEKAIATDFQIGALLHLERTDRLKVPRVVHTIAGESSGVIKGDGSPHCLRVMSWVSGELLENRELEVPCVADFGRALANLDRALAGYSHPGETPKLLWDLQRVPELRKLLEFIDTASIRDAVDRAIDDYEGHVLPAHGELRSQVIHSDANPGNVLLAEDGIGFIDFSDILKAPLVFEVAIAISYLRSFDADPMRFVVPFVDAYHRAMPLDSLEADLLFDLVRARLATTITLLYWRLGSRSESDPYRQKALSLESGAAQFLDLLDTMGSRQFREKLSFI